MNHYAKLLDIKLCLFDGTGSATGAGAGATTTTGGDVGTQGDTKAKPGNTRRAKSGEFQNVVFGKQSTSGETSGEASGEASGETSGNTSGQQQAPSAAGEEKQAGVHTTSDTLEERRRAFSELVNGEFKDVYTQETQRIIDRRFRETKNLEQRITQNQPIIDMLMDRYNISDGDVSKLSVALENDDAYWSDAADEAGMSVEQYKKFQKLQRENAEFVKERQRQHGQHAAQAQLQKWYSESEGMKAVYPDFDLNVESKNPQFLSMLRAGVPVQHAYEVIHMDTIKEQLARSTAKATEKQVVEGIRTKGVRPAENGTTSQSGFTIKDDVSKLTRKDREEIARRAARGEKISF